MPPTLFLVEEVENIVVFPHDVAQFRASQVTVGVTYEIHGDTTDKTPSSSTSLQPSSPYGAYTAPVYPPSKQPQPFMHASKSKPLRLINEFVWSKSHKALQ